MRNSKVHPPSFFISFIYPIFKIYKIIHAHHNWYKLDKSIIHKSLIQHFHDIFFSSSSQRSSFQREKILENSSPRSIPPTKSKHSLFPREKKKRTRIPLNEIPLFETTIQLQKKIPAKFLPTISPPAAEKYLHPNQQTRNNTQRVYLFIHDDWVEDLVKNDEGQARCRCTPPPSLGTAGGERVVNEDRICIYIALPPSPPSLSPHQPNELFSFA